jgi:hypothetical protein
MHSKLVTPRLALLLCDLNCVVSIPGASVATCDGSLYTQEITTRRSTPIYDHCICEGISSDCEKLKLRAIGNSRTTTGVEKEDLRKG